jgi:hypothetical protein
MDRVFPADFRLERPIETLLTGNTIKPVSNVLPSIVESHQIFDKTGKRRESTTIHMSIRLRPEFGK